MQLWYWTGSGDPTEKTRSVGAGKSPPAANFEADPQYLAVGVELKGLTKVFATRVAVNNLNFKMYQNQVTSLLGHNGAGKTTTMSMLTGLIRPSTGTAYIEGFDIRNEMGRIRRSLGLCPQNNILFDSLTVEEHLKFYCAVRHSPPPPKLKSLTKKVCLYYACSSKGWKRRRPWMRFRGALGYLGWKTRGGHWVKI